MLQIKNIKKQYQTGQFIQKALDDVSLNLRDNEFVAILGPSGSGKTTFLNIIGRLDQYDEGELIINHISTKYYKDRDWDSYRNHTIGFVFQSYNLIPHQTVLSNVELALTISGISQSERKQKAIKALEQVGLKEHINKLPHQLSGGQMQRVAIARALVNNPDILLADEPTGALDSDTSIQVMELLKEVAKDRLVVMVTHNPELAQQYATRIVTLKDGHIINDTDPYNVEETTTPVEHKNMGKTSMSLMTSLSLSFHNLKTKKGRTLLTAFAGSIGIIGIAAILSLSNGVSEYIKTIEEETLSEYPLQIQSTGIDMSSMLIDHKEPKKENEVQVSTMLTTMFSTVGSNDLESLKQYIESDETNIKDYTTSIEYSYKVTPQIYNQYKGNIRQVHPDQSFKSLGMGSQMSQNSLMSSAMSTNIFAQMPQESKLYEDQYDIKAGRWPKAYDEVVVVLTNNGNISDFMLYSLGLKDPKELDQMLNQFSKEEKVNVPTHNESYTYDDLLNVKFKLVNSSDYYQYDQTYQIYKDKTDNEQYMKSLVNKGKDLKVVGVVQAKEGASATMLMPGVYYTPMLEQYVIDQAKDSRIVKDQLKNHQINVFTNKPFNDTSKEALDLKQLISIDTNQIQKAFKINQQAFIPQINPEKQNVLINTILNGYGQYINEHPEYSLTAMTKQLQDFMQSTTITKQVNELIQEAIKNNQETTLKEEDLKNIFNTILKEYDNYTKTNNLVTIQDSISGYLSSKEVQMLIQKELFNQIPTDLIQIDENQFNKAFQMKMTDEDISELMLSMMNKDISSYEGNLNKLGYADLNQPALINIYPHDFESKEQIISILDAYNTKMEKVDENKVISYTDFVGTLMSSVTDIINVISYVLVAFVAISLVVSSIMIGVITYISVLERKKEIGILRAMGASKHNISTVFNAETVIIGFLAGIIGIGMTLILLFPANQLIHSISGQVNMNASLPINAAIILILLSTLLTLIGGLIPSKKAAKEDPVTALRNE